MTRERQLSQVLIEFARTLVTDFPIQGILDHLVQRITEVLPVTGAGVMLMSRDAELHFAAASDEVVLRIESLQAELGEGPCIEAFRRGQAVAIPDLSRDERFRRFSPRALAAGLAAVYTFPLRLDGRILGALDVYRDTPGSFDAADMTAAQVLADVTAAYLFNAQARTDAREATEELRRRTLHDPLTGLPNRTLLGERLEHAVLKARRSHKMAAVLFVDLDRFKLVNDSYGHEVGDQLLVSVVDRLAQVLRPGDTLARVSGDEFVVLCEDLDNPAQAELVAERVGRVLVDPFDIAGAEVAVTASVGIAFAGRGDEIPARLLRDADAAMYVAKRAGGAHHRVSDGAASDDARKRAQLERDLRRARRRAELRLVYQPIVATTDGRMTGVEALLRWEHPELGCVRPQVIVPLAEQLGLIGELGEWALRHACEDRQHWSRSSPRSTVCLAVNVSAHQLMRADFAKTVQAVLWETGTEPESVCLEVTESVFADDGAGALNALHELKRSGVALALDDFGTGYCSLGYLKRFPVDVVKVDQGFIADLGHDPANSEIVTAVVNLAHILGLTVVAEGVETAQQLQAVIDLDCDQAQGYYLARPLPADELGDQMLTAQAPPPSRVFWSPAPTLEH